MLRSQYLRNRKQQLCFSPSCVMKLRYLSCSVVQICQLIACLVNLHLVRVLARKFSQVVFVTWAWKMKQHQSLSLNLVTKYHKAKVELTCCCRLYFATQWWRWYWAVCTRLSLLCITRACHNSPEISWDLYREILCWYGKQLDVKHVLLAFFIASGHFVDQERIFEKIGPFKLRARQSRDNHENHVLYQYSHWYSFHSRQTKHIQPIFSLDSPLLYTSYGLCLFEIYSINPWELLS